MFSDRERLNQGMEVMIDSPALDWGVQIERVEIKDVALPEAMKRSMSRQAEAERERRARVIIADGEHQASEKLAQAAEAMTEHPAALQLRLLQTVVEVAAEKNSTLVLPFPVELLRFLERSTPPENAKSSGRRWSETTDRRHRERSPALTISAQGRHDGQVPRRPGRHNRSGAACPQVVPTRHGSRDETSALIATRAPRRATVYGAGAGLSHAGELFDSW